MALNLSIIKSPTGVSLAATEKSFSEQGGSIGRGDGNDWVLSDPDRFLSSRHCSLSFEGGQYYLTDTSTNGTFVNGAPEPLGKGGRVPLNNGDTIEVGDYQFRAEMQTASDVIADPFGAPSEADPFDMPLEADPFEASPFVASDDPFAAPSPPPLSPSPDPFGSDPFSAQSDIPLNPDPLQMDPLAALDGAGSPPLGANPIPDSLGLEDIPSTDFMTSSSGNDNYGTQSSHSDGAGALSQAVDWPEPKNENLIPDDWDDLMGGAIEEPLQVQQPPEPQQSIPQVHAPVHEVRQEHRSLPLTDPPKVVNQAKPRPKMNEPLLSERKPDRPEPIQATPKSAPKTQAAPKQRPVQEKVALDVGNALLSSLNLDNRQLSEEEVTNIYQTIGELMPVIITGMMQVLRSRASIKNEFRMNVTTIQPIENNPLKFSADASEAIENMFVRKSGAYMGPKQAFQEGFDGIGEHQVAIIAGIRAAFKSMMDRFNPELLERQFEKQGKGGMLPGMQKTKYWNNYTDYYKGFVDNMENTFQYLFGDEFVQAYEEQLRRLAVERKKRQKFDN